MRLAVDFLQLGLWNKVMLLQDWSHHYQSFITVTMNTWSLQCTHLHRENWLGRRVIVFFSSSAYTGLDNSVDVSRKAEDAYSTGAPGVCSRFLVESELLFLLFLLCIYYFGYFVCLPRLVFVPGFPLESWFPWLLFQGVIIKIKGDDVTVIMEFFLSNQKACYFWN